MWYNEQNGGIIMISIQRRDEIKKYLLKEKNVSVNEMAIKLNVSGETIRRDLEALSQEGFCEKTYGGASLLNRSITNVPNLVKKELFIKEKQEIAKTAAQFISPNDCIFLDHCTTVSELCALIKNMPLTVVTNSLWVIKELAGLDNIELVITGGHVRTMPYGLFGQETLNFLKTHYVDKCFFSCRGLHKQQCVFDANEYIASFHQSLVQHSTQNFLLADHSKFGVCGFINIFSSYEELDNLITDTEPDEEWMEIFKQNNVNVHYSI